MVMDEPHSRLQSTSTENTQTERFGEDEEVGDDLDHEDGSKEEVNEQKEEEKDSQANISGIDGTGESDEGGVIIPEGLRTPLSASRPLTPAEPSTQDTAKTPTKKIINSNNAHISTPDITLPPDMSDPFTEEPPSPLKEASNPDSTITTATSSIPVLAHPSSQPRASSPIRSSKIPKLTRDNSPPKKTSSPNKSIVTPATSTASLSLTTGSGTASSTDDAKSTYSAPDSESAVATNAEETGN